jgi:exodeoxyribonuclease VII small subunit
VEKTKKEKAPSFEKAVTRLDEIVVKLEKGDVPLEEALALFEEGTKLVALCGGLLDGAEQKVRMLARAQEEDDPAFVPFEPEE